MEAWVIRKKETKQYLNQYGEFDSLQNASLYGTRSSAGCEIEVYNYLDCKPVKVKIEEIKE